MLKYKAPLMVMPLIIGIWIALDAVHSMVTLWLGTDTYMHGAFVIPLSAMMAYRKALPKIASVPLHSFQVFLITFSWSILMLFGNLSMINVIQQFAVISLIPIIVLSCFGWRTFWYYRSSLILLFFAIPVGDFLIPYLQSITADMSVWLLKATDVSVLRNGWYISIASADFRVAEACSGVNFLISTFTVSVFYALTYMDKAWKRVVFITLGIVVPLVANGFRVYMIIMIAELGNVEAATGVDHLVYGWIFFVFILIMLFLIGHFMQDDIVENNGKYLESIKDIHFPFVCKPLLLIVCLQIPVLFFVTTMPNVDLESFERKKVDASDLLGPKYPYSDNIESFDVNGAKFYRITYENEGAGKKVISFENRLFNPDVWSVKSMIKVVLNDVPLIKTSLIDLSGRRYTLYYTFNVGDIFVNNTLELKFQQALHKLTRKDFGGKVYMWMVKNSFDESGIELPK